MRTIFADVMSATRGLIVCRTAALALTFGWVICITRTPNKFVVRTAPTTIREIVDAIITSTKVNAVCSR